MQKETDELKTLLAEVSQVEKNKELSRNTQPVIDVLDLPPRAEIHKSSSKKVNIKLSSPVIRFIFVILIIILIVFLAYYYLEDELFIFKIE